MAVDELLGHVVTLPILRFGPPGAFLAIDGDEAGAPTILLPGAEIPEGAREGDELDVFVYRDSEGRPIATTREPTITRGEVAFLEVTDTTPIGAFVDWGLEKELLVPFAEQTSELSVGARHPIGLYVDESGRLAGTMRVSEMLTGAKGDFQLDEWVSGEAWRKDGEIGLFVIVEGAFVGLVPAREPHGLSRGERARFRVTHVYPDGKIELSLRGHGHEEIDGDAARVREVLARPGTPHVGDYSSPEEIRRLFGLSKKAFKRAAGRLLKERVLTLDGEGSFVLAERDRPREAPLEASGSANPPRRR